MTTQNGPPPYSEFTKSQEAAASTPSGGGQQVGYGVPAPGPPFYTTPNLQPVQQVVPSIAKPPHKGPPDYLVVALVTMIICGLLNITSMFFGVPAIIFASRSRYNRTSTRNFKSARDHSNIALGLIIACIIYTLLWALLITGLVVSYVIVGSPGTYSPSTRCNLCYSPSRGYYCAPSRFYSYYSC